MDEGLPSERDNSNQGRNTNNDNNNNNNNNNSNTTLVGNVSHLKKALEQLDSEGNNSPNKELMGEKLMASLDNLKSLKLQTSDTSDGEGKKVKGKNGNSAELTNVISQVCDQLILNLSQGCTF